MPLFEEIMLPHLPTAYNLARWLLRNDHDAEDSVQEAYLRAWQAFAHFRGGDGRAWLLTIVRNVCYNRLRQARGAEPHEVFDETLHSPGDAADVVARLRTEAGPELLRTALDALPEKMRELIVLHDLEGMTYREIATVASITLGTVMSRLSRARAKLQQELRDRLAREEGSLR